MVFEISSHQTRDILCSLNLVCIRSHEGLLIALVAQSAPRMINKSHRGCGHLDISW